MPYRAMLFTVLTVVIALVAVVLWANAVAPLVAQYPAPAAVATNPATSPARSLTYLFKAVLLLSFLLVCLLLIVGFAATFREWIRLRTTARASRKVQTNYVDAWKVAGDRLDAPASEDPTEHEDS